MGKRDLTKIPGLEIYCQVSLNPLMKNDSDKGTKAINMLVQ